MAENSKIEWRLSGMFPLVARFTQRYSVTNIKPEFWEISKRFYMMGIQIAAFFIATFLTCEIVTNEYIKTPAFVFSAKPLTSPFSQFTVFEAMAVLAFSRMFSKYTTDFFSRFYRMGATLHWRLISFTLNRKKFLGCIRMALPFKSAYTPLPTLFNFHSFARLTTNVKSITSTFIDIKSDSWLPMFPFSTPLFSYDFLNVMVIRYSYS